MQSSYQTLMDITVFVVYIIGRVLEYIIAIDHLDSLIVAWYCHANVCIYSILGNSMIAMNNEIIENYHL